MSTVIVYPQSCVFDTKYFKEVVLHTHHKVDSAYERSRKVDWFIENKRTSLQCKIYR